MLTNLPPAQCRAVKAHLLSDLQQGYSVRETLSRSPVSCHPVTIYRLRQRLLADPATALGTGRHGYPSKLRGEVRDCLVSFCQEAPHTPSHVVQAALQERFGVQISISQLNRFRAAHHLSSRLPAKKSSGTRHPDRTG